MEKSSDMFTKLIESQLKIEIIKEYRFCPNRRFLADYYIPSLRLLIEQEGGIFTGQAHGSVTGIMRDIEKYNLATTMGYSILRFIPQDLVSMKTIEMIKEFAKNRMKI